MVTYLTEYLMIVTYLTEYLMMVTYLTEYLMMVTYLYEHRTGPNKIILYLIVSALICVLFIWIVSAISSHTIIGCISNVCMCSSSPSPAQCLPKVCVCFVYICESFVCMCAFVRVHVQFSCFFPPSCALCVLCVPLWHVRVPFDVFWFLEHWFA